MDEMSRKVAAWRRIMDHHREQGIAFVDPATHEFAHDEDWPEVIKREQAEHEARQRGEP